ncbi:MAG: EpsG family protein [Thermaurantiacus sp.]
MTLYSWVYLLLGGLRLTLAGQPGLQRQIYWLVLLFLFLFVAFRFEIGCDWSGYLNQFDLQRDGGFAETLEARDPAWWTLLEAVHVLGLPYPWINVGTALIFFTGIHMLAQRQPDPLAFLILLFPVLVIQMPMSALRQACAIGVMCMAFCAFMDARLFRFIALTAVAALFHASAALFILLAPLVRGRLTPGRILAAAVLALPGGLVLLSGELAEIARDRYLDSGLEAYGAVYRVAVLSLTGLFFFVMMRRPWNQQFPADVRFATIGAGIMVALFGVVQLSSVIGDRIGYYMIPIQAMLFARIPYLRLGPLRPLFTIGPWLGLGFLLTYWTLSSFHFGVCYRDYRSWMFGFPRDVTFPF